MRRAINLAVCEDEKILIVRKRNVWILPGGKPEEGEGDLECLEREIMEELGTGMIMWTLYGSFTGKTPHKNDILEAIVYLGDFRPSREISEARFVNNPYDYNLSDITKEIIDSLKKDNYI
jgi:8-oxo-dGTP diphosphatase